MSAIIILFCIQELTRDLLISTDHYYLVYQLTTNRYTACRALFSWKSDYVRFPLIFVKGCFTDVVSAWFQFCFTDRVKFH